MKNIIFIKNVYEIQFWTFKLNFKPKNFKFPIKTVKIWTEIMIQIKLYMHFLTLDEEQHSKMRNVARKIFVYAFSAYFRKFIFWVLKWVTIYVNYILYIFYYGYTWMYYFRNKRILKLHSMVSNMSLCFVVCMWLLLWQRQFWQKQFSQPCYFHCAVRWVQPVSIFLFLLYINLRNFAIQS
jgi:hypothetical protein